MQPLVSQMFGSIQEENCGSLNLSIGYETELSLLTVHLIRAQDLVPPRDSISWPGLPSIDPYCQLTLLPSRKRHFQTRIQRRTTNPEFDEEFVFDVTQGEMSQSALEVAIFDGSESAGGPGECLGTVQIPLDEISLTERVWMWKGISPFVKDVEVSSSSSPCLAGCLSTFSLSFWLFRLSGCLCGSLCGCLGSSMAGGTSGCSIICLCASLVSVLFVWLSELLSG